MGACATKPKADTMDAPAPLPEKVEVAATNTVTETKEGEEGKGATESDKTPSEPLVEEKKIDDRDKAVTQIPKSTEVELATKKTETSEEKTLISPVCAPVQVEADKEIEVAPVTEIQETETVEEKKIAEDGKQATESEKPATLLDEKTEVKTTESEVCAEDAKP